MTEFDFSPEWKEILQKKQIETPTAVQKQVIPLLAARDSVLFESETGTGKTLAYLIPLLDSLDAQNPQVQLVICAPTHELCSQIKAEIQSVTALKTALLIGGAPLKRQFELLKEKPVIVVGGPVRLVELARLKKLKVDGVRALVLDEVDRLLSPELRDATVELAALMPEGRQLAACSATIKPKMKEILEAASPRSAPVTVLSLPKEDVLQKRISHWAIFAEQRDKIDTLRRFLVAEKPAKALVFTARPDQAVNIASKLQYKKIECEVLHAREGKQERKAAIDRFRSGKCTLLITSDLAARGLDLPGITHIIQMDVPTNDDFFVHRAGRTARAGLTGINLCIGDAHEMRLLKRIERRLEITVYPKLLYQGKVLAPSDVMAFGIEEEEPGWNEPRREEERPYRNARSREETATARPGRKRARTPSPGRKR